MKEEHERRLKLMSMDHELGFKIKELRMKLMNPSLYPDENAVNVQNTDYSVKSYEYIENLNCGISRHNRHRKNYITFFFCI